MNLKMITLRVGIVLVSILMVAASIVISPIVGIYCIISDYIRYMEFSIKDALCGFVVLPITAGIFSYVCCTRGLYRVFAIMASENNIDALFKEIGF